MRFLVTTNSVEVGPLLQPQQSLQIIEQLVLPSLRMLAQWEQDGKAQGGSFLGERSGVIILEADSIEEANQMLGSLPFWGINTWQVRPLVPVQASLQQAEQQLEKMRGMMQQSG